LLVLFLLLLQWLYGGGSTLNPFSSSLFSRRRDDSQASSSSRSGNWRSRFGSLTRSLDYPIPIGETQMSAARMEFLLELMRLQRWVGTAYLVARAVDRLVDGLKTLTSSALVGNSKSDGSSHKVSCPQAVLELLRQRNMSIDEFDDAERVVLASAVSVPSSNPGDDRTILCGLHSLKRLLQYSLPKQELLHSHRLQQESLRSILLWGPPGIVRHPQL
jgi:hypothetical protein